MRPARPQGRTVVAIAAAVLTLHGLALAATESVPVDASRPSRAAALTVRWIEPPAGPVAPIEATPPHSTTPSPRPTVRHAPRSTPSVAHVATKPLATIAFAEVAAIAPPPAAPVEPSERLGDPAAAVAPPNVDAAVPNAAPAPAPVPAPIKPDTPIPVYKTRLPPPTTLHYEFERSGIVGTGTLQWRPQDKGYVLRLEGQIAGLTLLTQTSEGSIDANGLAPSRFTDQRTRRAAQAANFQRDRGVISFSGPQDQYALVPGAQDRLSWMLQLGAIVAAEPARARAGQRVVLYVAGSRGDVDTWALSFVGAETVRAAGANIPAIKFMREARKPGDSQVEIWLDPARHYVPVHAKLTSGSDIFELLLKDADTHE